ncbi:dysbindin domain-containing protein 1 isoform X1 [Malurus melanocephalus]|uniref:dysbindin domain-containing protein 1 isoform X1 n=1 Tax=Malurus melanocephalus TaxID=175006 RepID=UPI002547DAD9|nr:dysbindin domain-containing protein 1 isoform X1 [Malurus melanocephalus]
MAKPRERSAAPPSNATLRPSNGGGASGTGAGIGRGHREGTPGRSGGTSWGPGREEAAAGTGGNGGTGGTEQFGGNRGSSVGTNPGVPLCAAQAPPNPRAPGCVPGCPRRRGLAAPLSHLPAAAAPPLPRVPPPGSSRSPPCPPVFPPGASRPSVPPIPVSPPPVSPPPPRRAGPYGLRAGTGPAQHRTGTGTGTGIRADPGPWRLRQRPPQPVKPGRSGRRGR